MINIQKFAKDHISLCTCTFGIAILGYLGYHTVQWIINKCRKTKKIEIVVQNSPISPLSTKINITTPLNSIIHQSNFSYIPTKSDDIKANSKEEFIKKIKKHNFFYNKNSQMIAAHLLEIIPKNFKLEDIVSLVFEQCQTSHILILLDAILIADPLFRLSPYNQICRTIVEDKQHLLTNESFLSMLKENKLDDDKEKMAACYDLAYRMNHPNIYCLSETTPSFNEYTLNFLWVNLNSQDRIQNIAQNIFKDGLDLSENVEFVNDTNTLEKEGLENWNKIKKSFSYRISKWADVNPNSQINLWYDSALVTQKAQQKTFEMMNYISQSKGVNLKLRDIRQLSNIDGEIGNSLHPGTQVYYRVDILKALITDHMISAPEESAKYCVFSDIDIEPMSSQQLFDQRTLNYLSSAGYVFNRVGKNINFENSFFIFNREKENLQKIHNKTIIQWTASIIQSSRNFPRGTRINRGYTLDSQFVFNRYYEFRTQMGELDDDLSDPRKVIKCPESQFETNFSNNDYKSETSRFIGDSNIPYTRKGRNFDQHGYDEVQVDALIHWKAVPLHL